MELNRVQWALKNDWKIIAVLAFIARLSLFLLIPVDWNSDNYHHWQIRYYTLQIGLRQIRMWGLWDTIDSVYVLYKKELLPIWMFWSTIIIKIRNRVCS